MRTQPILQGLLVGASLLLLWPSAAQAKPEFPGAIQEAAGMVCVPTCLLCHTVTPGTEASWKTQPFPNALRANGLTDDPDTMQTAWNGYAAANPANAALVQQGIDPQDMSNICGPTYGCGATVAQRPLSEAKHYNDPAPAIAAALTLLAGIFAIRRRRR